MNLKDSFLGYLEYERNYSQRTIRYYRDDLEAFESFFSSLEGQLTWETLDADVIRAWLVSMMEAGHKETSVNRRLSAIRSFYRYALKRGLIIKDPAHTLQGPKKKKPLPSFLREDELNELLDGIYFDESFEGKRDRLILSMFYHTGIRLSELTGMDVSDVCIERMELKVLGKRSKERVIPFGEELKQLLLDYSIIRERVALPEETALFINSKGARISNGSVWGLVKRYLSQVTTLSKKSPHVLRHTFATVLLNHEADLESVKELLGHSSLSATEVYTHTTFEELKKEYKLAHPRA